MINISGVLPDRYLGGPVIFKALALSQLAAQKAVIIVFRVGNILTAYNSVVSLLK